MATTSKLEMTVDQAADALGRGLVGRFYREFPALARVAAYCAMVEDLAPGTPMHDRATALLEIQQSFTADEIGASRARDQLILGWDWWRWWARDQVYSDVMGVAA